MDLSFDQKIKINNLIKKVYKTQEECGKIGHVSNFEWFVYDSGKMSGICENCGGMYERNPTTEEREKYSGILRDPFMNKLIFNIENL
ncbi:MAG: hypothetical protein AABY32_05565 [Nanoarchaeota archaeon]